jgi:hypothetical protein
VPRSLRAPQQVARVVLQARVCPPISTSHIGRDCSPQVATAHCAWSSLHLRPHPAVSSNAADTLWLLVTAHREVTRHGSPPRPQLAAAGIYKRPICALCSVTAAATAASKRIPAPWICPAVHAHAVADAPRLCATTSSGKLPQHGCPSPIEPTLSASDPDVRPAAAATNAAAGPYTLEEPRLCVAHAADATAQDPPCTSVSTTSRRFGHRSGGGFARSPAVQ